MKNIVIIFLILFVSAQGVFAYYVRKPAEFRSYKKQQIYNKDDESLTPLMFKSYHERNHYVTEKWFCVQPDPNKYGYLYVKYTSGRVVKQYQTDYYTYYEPIKCDKRYDQYTNVRSVEEAKNYVFNQDTLKLIN